MQHTEVPKALTEMIRNKNLKDGDILVYAVIRKYSNSTRTCYPSLPEIKRLSGYSLDKIRESLKRLKECNLIDYSKTKTSYRFIFLRPDLDKPFEMYREEFFLNKEIPSNVKDWYMCLQCHLTNKGTNNANMNYSDLELSKMTNRSINTIKKYKKILKDANILTELPTKYRDEAGFKKMMQIFDMPKMGQFGLWAEIATKAIVENKLDIEDMKLQIQKLTQRVIELESMESIKTEFNF